MRYPFKLARFVLLHVDFLVLYSTSRGCSIDEYMDLYETAPKLLLLALCVVLRAKGRRRKLAAKGRQPSQNPDISNLRSSTLITQLLIHAITSALITDIQQPTCLASSDRTNRLSRSSTPCTMHQTMNQAQRRPAPCLRRAASISFVIKAALCCVPPAALFFYHA